MISVQEASQLITEELFSHIQAVVPGKDALEWVELARARGRVLAEKVVADRDFPPFDRVAMDGIAVRSDALAERLARGEHALPIASTQAAGEPRHALAEPESCIEIMTGASLPAGCDAVLPVEWLRVENGWAHITDGHLEDALRVAPGRNIHARASDRRAGDILLRAGQCIRAPEVAALASVGCAKVQVAALPRVHIITTGNETVPVASRVKDHQIRQSNGPALAAALGGHGYAPDHVVHVPDNEVPIRTAVLSGLGSADVIILTGGVSAGRFDLVPGVLASCGVREVFHKIRQRPGKPLWFGAAKDGAFVFGLPGNPVSALVCLYRYVLPFLSAFEVGRAAGVAATGRTFRSCRHHVACHDLPAAKIGWTQFVPVRMNANGVATRVPMNGSGDLLALTGADGFVEWSADMPLGHVPFYAFD